MEYLYAGLWVYHSDTPKEEDAVARSRQVWKLPGVGGVRIVRTESRVFKEAVKPGYSAAEN